jgi:hypothetical protein
VVIEMSFWIWLLIALCFFVYAIFLFVKKARAKEQPLWKTIKEWAINVIDIFSGGF